MRYWSISFLIIFLIGCKGDFSSPQVQSAYDSVMKVHDEVMPEMSTMNKLKRKLRKLDKQDDLVLSLIKDLEAADDGMMDWMADFKLDKKGSIKDQLQYLANEQVKIDKVSVDMKSAMHQAKTFLDKNNIKKK